MHTTGYVHNHYALISFTNEYALTFHGPRTLPVNEPQTFGSNAVQFLLLPTSDLFLH
jgi:hypothetical protein